MLYFQCESRPEFRSTFVSEARLASCVSRAFSFTVTLVDLLQEQSSVLGKPVNEFREVAEIKYEKCWGVCGLVPASFLEFTETCDHRVDKTLHHFFSPRRRNQLRL
jgi:hypothetical protein